MIGITHKPRGLDALRNQLSALPGVSRIAAAQALDDIAESAAGEVQHGLQHSLGIGPHARSVPGAPPADPKGRLAAAVTAARAADGTGTSVTVDLPFARDLEFGTAKVAARPFLRPAMLRSAGAAKAVLGEALRSACSALKGGAR